MNSTIPASWAAALAGILLAIAGVYGGFAGFVFAVVLGAIGWLIGAQVEGRVDVLSALGRRGRG
ncbi:hypothetical protein SAMN06264364_11751 [Quadrisphaera granulorum]|uniref:Small integral membrane protein DUF2273 n=1 Tax=Quadrisphaera granulorum TaxID=317664 RepID=A0A316A5J3_9ACTN|nr:DUF2273 domain-containing protein [Quadrisphaera granulorum]PWJ52799.1 hypothetical protein BXY45_11751 [Quadrisphaera granulorum]SZE97404.1 hypothetical protein SAMN06264364_11751 [Quadrisphaera granulorum]